MKKRAHIRPTDGELEILRVLWGRGPSGVGKVHKVLHATKGTAYNTTLKLLQIMLEKGLVTRDDSERPQLYQASLPESEMQQHLVSDLLHRAFGGSARKLVAALTASDIPKDELAEIRRLLAAPRKEGGQ
jgi:BlaI family transcriptional regulator, penicillinase repressor